MGEYISSDMLSEGDQQLDLPSIDTILQLGTAAANFTSSDCGKTNGLATGGPLQPGQGMAINGNTDLSSCVVGNFGGRVYSITAGFYERGPYKYIILVDAQGPKGAGSGSIYLTFGDQTGDHYRLRIFDSTRKIHFVRYNSDAPGITTLNWNDKKP